MSKHFHQLKVKEVKRETLNTVSVVFDIPEELKPTFRYEAGQYLTLKKELKGEEVRRSYSISSCMEMDEDIQISSKMLEGGKMSTFLFRELGVGDVMDVMPPEGSFIFEDLSKPIILFAAGSGITPIFSIIQKALKKGEQSIHLYYGNRNEEEIIFKEELKKLRLDNPDRLMVQHFLSSNGERLDKNRTENILSGLGAEKQDTEFFVCGPEGMIESVRSGLESSGVNKDQIHIEYFASPTKEDEKSEVVLSGDVGDVILVIDGQEHQTTLQKGEFILDAGNRIGIDPPFSCQSGVCTTCKAKLLSGEVEMENNFGLGDDEIEEGYVLTCIGKPTTAGVKISWDEV